MNWNAMPKIKCNAADLKAGDEIDVIYQNGDIRNHVTVYREADSKGVVTVLTRFGDTILIDTNHPMFSHALKMVSDA